MARLPVLSGRQVCDILVRHGFAEVRRRGSHVRLERQVGAVTIKLTVPLHRTVKRGTLHDIIKESGLPRDLFE